MQEQRERFARAIAAIDAANAEDPRREPGPDGQPCPRELLYAQRMSEMLERFAPGADEAVRLAVRAQHVQRWKTPRTDFPEGREGYLRWRTQLYGFHAALAARLLGEAGYDAATIARVRKAVGKKGLRRNPDTQLLEDVANLVFIEHYLRDFADSKPDYGEDKWLDILSKTWKKISPEAQAFALSGRIALPEALRPLIDKAVAGARAGPS